MNGPVQAPPVEPGPEARVATVVKRPAPGRLRPAWRSPNRADRIYGVAVLLFGMAIPALFAAIVFRVADASWMSIRTFGWRFITGTEWNPVLGDFGALPFIFGTVASSVIALLIALPLAVGLAIFLTELSPRWLAGPIAFGTELLAAIPSVVYGL